MDDIVKDFLIESRENLDRLDQELIHLESDPSSKELLGSIFRTIHTIKGTCGFLGFARLEKLAHAGESLLACLRDGKVQFNKDIASALLSMVDAVRQMLAAIENSGQDGDEDCAFLIAHLKGLESAPATDSPKVFDAVVTASGAESVPPQTTLPRVPAETSVPEEDLADPNKLGGLLLQRGHVRPEDLKRALAQQEIGRKRLGEILIEQGAAHPEDVLAAQHTLESRNPEAAIETIRVGVNLLDRLMNLVGELVLARNQLLQLSNNSRDASLQAVSQRMNLIASELQEEVMKTRMQPVGSLWKKLPRLVRDLSLSCGKEVQLEMDGHETELDRTILEAIKDPLTHLVRNCIDHGIESPESRMHSGKPRAGTVKLRAFHEGGQVNLEISDDGAGLNTERIRQKAVERGLVSAQQSARVPDADILNLIFLPGFSTAETVTKVSGRGVGMDVVKTNVEKIGGAIDLQSVAGAGTTVRIKIPLTLAIIPALMVIARGERFAIPQVSLLELLRLEGNDPAKEIESIHGFPVYRLRGRLLPLVYLSRELGLEDDTALRGLRDSAVNIVVVQADGRQFGLVVDEIIETEEIVVKPLGKQLNGIPAYSGATIMGDGSVALILDILGLAQHAQVLTGTQQTQVETESAGKLPQSDLESAGERETLLVVECGARNRLAIPLTVVARLEEFSSSAIEFAGPQQVLQYRGHIMPLLQLSDIVSGTPSRAGNSPTDCQVQVVVYSQSGRSVGLIVDAIVDIVEETVTFHSPPHRRGVLGSCIVNRRVTELLDVRGLVQDALPGFIAPFAPVLEHQS